jgi:hypothetical protein
MKSSKKGSQKFSKKALHTIASRIGNNQFLKSEGLHFVQAQKHCQKRQVARSAAVLQNGL